MVYLNSVLKIAAVSSNFILPAPDGTITVSVDRTNVFLNKATYELNEHIKNSNKNNVIISNAKEKTQNKEKAILGDDKYNGIKLNTNQQGFESKADLQNTNYQRQVEHPIKQPTKYSAKDISEEAKGLNERQISGKLSNYAARFEIDAEHISSNTKEYTTIRKKLGLKGCGDLVIYNAAIRGEGNRIYNNINEDNSMNYNLVTIIQYKNRNDSKIKAIKVMNKNESVLKSFLSGNFTESFPHPYTKPDRTKAEKKEKQNKDENLRKKSKDLKAKAWNKTKKDEYKNSGKKRESYRLSKPFDFDNELFNFNENFVPISEFYKEPSFSKRRKKRQFGRNNHLFNLDSLVEEEEIKKLVKDKSKSIVEHLTEVYQEREKAIEQELSTVKLKEKELLKRQEEYNKTDSIVTRWEKTDLEDSLRELKKDYNKIEERVEDLDKIKQKITSLNKYEKTLSGYKKEEEKKKKQLQIKEEREAKNRFFEIKHMYKDPEEVKVIKEDVEKITNILREEKSGRIRTGGNNGEERNELDSIMSKHLLDYKKNNNGEMSLNELRLFEKSRPTNINNLKKYRFQELKYNPTKQSIQSQINVDLHRFVSTIVAPILTLEKTYDLAYFQSKIKQIKRIADLKKDNYNMNKIEKISRQGSDNHIKNVDLYLKMAEIAFKWMGEITSQIESYKEIKRDKQTPWINDIISHYVGIDRLKFNVRHGSTAKEGIITLNDDLNLSKKELLKKMNYIRNNMGHEPIIKNPGDFDFIVGIENPVDAMATMAGKDFSYQGKPVNLAIIDPNSIEQYVTMNTTVLTFLEDSKQVFSSRGFETFPVPTTKNINSNALAAFAARHNMLKGGYTMDNSSELFLGKTKLVEAFAKGAKFNWESVLTFTTGKYNFVHEQETSFKKFLENNNLVDPSKFLSEEMSKNDLKRIFEASYKASLTMTEKRLMFKKTQSKLEIEKELTIESEEQTMNTIEEEIEMYEEEAYYL